MLHVDEPAEAIVLIDGGDTELGGATERCWWTLNIDIRSVTEIEHLFLDFTLQTTWQLTELSTTL